MRHHELVQRFKDYGDSDLRFARKRQLAEFLAYWLAYKSGAPASTNYFLTTPDHLLRLLAAACRAFTGESSDGDPTIKRLREKYTNEVGSIPSSLIAIGVGTEVGRQAELVKILAELVMEVTFWREKISHRITERFGAQRALALQRFDEFLYVVHDKNLLTNEHNSVKTKRPFGDVTLSRHINGNSTSYVFGHVGGAHIAFCLNNDDGGKSIVSIAEATGKIGTIVQLIDSVIDNLP